MDIIRIELSGLKATLEVTNKRIDDINGHLIEQGRRIDETNKRMDRLYEVIVRREEHEKLEVRIIKIEQDIAVIKERLAA